MIGVNPYCIMHNELYFQNPFEFQPERWLEPDAGTAEIRENAETRAIARQAFAAFALGETGCVGKSMAYQEISLIVAKTLWYFDFRRPTGKAGDLGGGQPGQKDGRHRADVYQLDDNQTADKDGPNLIFKPRENFMDDLVIGGSM